MPMLAAAILTLTACDPADRRDTQKERENRQYQAAMEDYRAGRIDAAAKGFEAAVRGDPANAEARFQLACLLHDAKKDALGAFCAYREYLQQRPGGDKAALAKQRMAVCERELAALLAEKHKLAAGKAAAAEMDRLRAAAKSAKERVAKLEAELAEAKRSGELLAAERTRLLAAIKGDAGEESAVAAAKPSIKEIKELLDEDEDSAPAAVAGEVAALRDEEKAETSQSSPLLTPRTAAETAAKKSAAAQAQQPKAAVRPPTYEVQEGDSLYKISMRFYGTIHAWRKIRDANKALISTDGRVQAGDTIKLP